MSKKVESWYWGIGPGIFEGEILHMDFKRAGELNILYRYFRRGGANMGIY